MDIDFGYAGSTSSDNTTTQQGNDGAGDATNLGTGKIDHNTNGEAMEDLEDQDDLNKGGEGGNQASNVNPDKNKGEKLDNSDTHELIEGTTIDVEGKTYTVDSDGNVRDENGSIFKEKAEVDEWIKTFDQVDDSQGGFDIAAIQEAIGTDILDENDKPVEFENSPEGVKAYVNAVIETSAREQQEAAINTFINKYPFVQDVVNYYVANGNSLDGWGEMPDRSGITIDENDESQQEAIIRTAWSEQGRKGDVESYIQYLKSSGILSATAKEELEGLQEADAAYKEQVAKQAQEQEEARIAQLEEYWDGVKKTIESKKIAGYQIPDNIIINRNGQKLSVTPNDFYNYLYRVDDNGQSQYYKDLAAKTPEARRDDEILRAYLMFVGGNYSNLVDMAINEKEVEKLKLRAKERSAKSIRITRPKTNSNSGGNIDLGYN